MPYYAVVVDGADAIRGFLIPVTRLLEIAGGSPDGTRYWLMTDRKLAEYRADPLVKRFELHTAACSWRDKSAEPYAPDATMNV